MVQAGAVSAPFQHPGCVPSTMAPAREGEFPGSVGPAHFFLEENNKTLPDPFHLLSTLLLPPSFSSLPQPPPRNGPQEGKQLPQAGDRVRLCRELSLEPAASAGGGGVRPQKSGLEMGCPARGDETGGPSLLSVPRDCLRGPEASRYL